MDAKRIARAGLLTAGAVALLYLGGLSPYWGLMMCIAAGVLTAVPLMRRARPRTALLSYVATGVLALLIVPRKSIAVAYIAFCGLYPIAKYAIEARCRRAAQPLCKFVFGNLCFAAVCAVVRFGFLPSFELPRLGRLTLIWLACCAVFAAYDTGLSRLIAALRRSLPPD